MGRGASIFGRCSLYKWTLPILLPFILFQPQPLLLPLLVLTPRYSSSFAITSSASFNSGHAEESQDFAIPLHPTSKLSSHLLSLFYDSFFALVAIAASCSSSVKYEPVATHVDALD